MAPLVSLLLLLSSQELQLHRPGPEHEGLVEALRIRMRDRLKDLPPRTAEGEDLSLPGMAVGWVESSMEGTDVFVVLRTLNGEPSVERIAIEGEPGFDRDRAIALKVEEALQGPWRTPIRPTEIRFVTGPARRESGLSFSLEAGGLSIVGDHDAGLRGGIFATLGPGLLTPSWRLEFRTGAQLVGERQFSTSTGTVFLDEWGWVVTLRALANLGPVEWGPALTAKVRYLDVKSVSSSGSTARDDALLPTLTLGSDLRIPFSRWVFVRVFVGGGINLERRRLDLRDMTQVDLGVWSGETQISLLVSTF